MMLTGTLTKLFALAAAISIAGVALADDKTPVCCAPAETVIHAPDDSKDRDKADDHKDDHADHDHGGGLFDVVKKAGNLNTLAAALGQAELEETLSHDAWTLFAPTDDAFAKLAPETLDALLKIENKAKLKTVLLGHVVKGVVASAAVTTDATTAKSEAGSELSIVKNADGKVSVNGAKVIRADTPASNGVIHTIDTVIIPHGLLD